MAFLAFVVGLAAGGGAVLWSQAQPAPRHVGLDEHAVELLLFQAVPPRTYPNGRESDTGALQVEGAVLLSGSVTSTVVWIGILDGSLDVRAPDLPVTVSPTGRLQSVNLRILVRDCKSATRWTPGDRPFSVRWRDEFGRAHLDRAGDHGKAVANSLISYIDAVCDIPLSR